MSGCSTNSFRTSSGPNPPCGSYKRDGDSNPSRRSSPSHGSTKCEGDPYETGDGRNRSRTSGTTYGAACGALISLGSAPDTLTPMDIEPVSLAPTGTTSAAPISLEVTPEALVPTDTTTRCRSTTSLPNDDSLAVNSPSCRSSANHDVREDNTDQDSVLDAGIPTLGPDDTLEQDVQDGVGCDTKIPSSSLTHLVRKEKPMSVDSSRSVGSFCGKASRNCDAGNGPGPDDVPRGMDPSRGVGSSRGEASCIRDAGGSDFRECDDSGSSRNGFQESDNPPGHSTGNRHDLQESGGTSVPFRNDIRANEDPFDTSQPSDTIQQASRENGDPTDTLQESGGSQTDL